MSSTSLERVVRPYGYMPFNFGNVFETSVIARGAGQAANIGILTVTAKTSARTTEIKGARWRFSMKKDNLEVSRVEQTLNIQNPDNPSESIQTKVLKSVTLRDTGNNDVTTFAFRTPDPNDPLNATVPPSLPSSAPATAQPIESSTPSIVIP